MKTPTWEPSAGALLAFLNAARSVRVAELYTFTTSGGTSYRFTDADQAITVNGLTFAVGPLLKRTKTKLIVGVQVDHMTVDLVADSTVMMGSQPMIAALAARALDNGTLKVETLYMDASGAQQGTLLKFGGRVGQVTCYGMQASIEVDSQAILLDVMIPSGVYQPGCRNTLFDGFCTLSKAAYKISTAAIGVTYAARTGFAANFTGTAAATSGYLTLGVATCTAGANAGYSRTIKLHSGSTVQAISPWPADVSIGDTFDFYPGCDKSMSTCSGKFANLAHFAGEPFIPVPETAA
jgi:uncharacterized phage protein (TIGR02218 family)